MFCSRKSFCLIQIVLDIVKDYEKKHNKKNKIKLLQFSLVIEKNV